MNHLPTIATVFQGNPFEHAQHIWVKIYLGGRVISHHRHYVDRFRHVRDESIRRERQDST